MRKIKDVLRLRHELGLGQRQIARSCAIAQATVAGYLKRAAAAGIGWPLPQDWDEARLEKAVFGAPATPQAKASKPLPDMAAVREQLQRHRDLTLQLIWEEYRQSNPDGYGYSYFCERYERWRRQQDVVLRLEHRPGEKLFVDWSQVDLAERLVRLEITKSGEQRDIPLSGELLGLLTRMRTKRDAGWPWCKHVFSRQGRPIRDYYASWRSACRRAKLGDGAKLLHDLRRTGVRNLIRAGVPEKVAMLISGHKTRSVFDRYHIVQTEDVREAMGKLEKYLGAK